jgi:hypothetical protein
LRAGNDGGAGVCDYPTNAGGVGLSKKRLRRNRQKSEQKRDTAYTQQHNARNYITGGDFWQSGILKNFADSHDIPRRGGIVDSQPAHYFPEIFGKAFARIDRLFESPHGCRLIGWNPDTYFKSARADDDCRNFKAPVVYELP